MRFPDILGLIGVRVLAEIIRSFFDGVFDFDEVLFPDLWRSSVPNFKKYLKYSLVIAAFMVAILGLFSRTNQAMTHLDTGDLITLNKDYYHFSDLKFVSSDLKLSSAKYAQNVYEDPDLGLELELDPFYSHHSFTDYTGGVLRTPIFAFDHATFENSCEIPLYLLFCNLKIDAV